ncbi:uncharacterized protein LOC117908797 [Vitis riparia]|uniref:uncharacterized protein LOC117908797 n=1 Tax=Vitis riparia TaxID=96939 RepID=UPI00155A23A8|nr:uncharacterized protein LOC117908797 [Vitis riparia]
MGFTCAQGVLTLLVLTASMLSVGTASRPIAGRPANYWNFGFNHSFWGPRNGHPFHPNNNNTRPPKKFIVGGSDHWRYGFNYTEWALNNGPFYVNDTLVFKYDPPSKTTFPHSVYLLPNLRSFLTCDLSRAEQVATVAQGGGEGFEFVLKNWWPHYFACGEHDGVHCKEGMMKFFVMLLPGPYHG